MDHCTQHNGLTLPISKMAAPGLPYLYPSPKWPPAPPTPSPPECAARSRRPSFSSSTQVAGSAVGGRDFPPL